VCKKGKLVLPCTVMPTIKTLVKSQDKSEVLSPGCLNQGKAKVFPRPYFINVKSYRPVAARLECSQTEELHWHISSEIVDFH
jgi:hypothetical protein